MFLIDTPECEIVFQDKNIFETVSTGQRQDVPVTRKVSLRTEILKPPLSSGRLAL